MSMSAWEAARSWAALDLHTGHVTAQVQRRHRSREFIALLKDLDTYYPPDYTLRLILDNHSAHISKETRAFLATRTNRFKYVHTPTHGSWLNIVETLFGKMTRTFLRHIRVQSWEELRDRILQGIAEINLGNGRPSLEKVRCAVCIKRYVSLKVLGYSILGHGHPCPAFDAFGTT